MEKEIILRTYTLYQAALFAVLDWMNENFLGSFPGKVGKSRGELKVLVVEPHREIYRKTLKEAFDVIMDYYYSQSRDEKTLEKYPGIRDVLALLGRIQNEEGSFGYMAKKLEAGFDEDINSHRVMLANKLHAMALKLTQDQKKKSYDEYDSDLEMIEGFREINKGVVSGNFVLSTVLQKALDFKDFADRLEEDLKKIPKLATTK